MSPLPPRSTWNRPAPERNSLTGGVKALRKGAFCQSRIIIRPLVQSRRARNRFRVFHKGMFVWSGTNRMWRGSKSGSPPRPGAARCTVSRCQRHRRIAGGSGRRRPGSARSAKPVAWGRSLPGPGRSECRQPAGPAGRVDLAGPAAAGVQRATRGGPWGWLHPAPGVLRPNPPFATFRRVAFGHFRARKCFQSPVRVLPCLKRRAGHGADRRTV